MPTSAWICETDLSGMTRSGCSYPATMYAAPRMLIAVPILHSERVGRSRGPRGASQAGNAGPSAGRRADTNVHVGQRDHLVRREPLRDLFEDEGAVFTTQDR